MKIQYSKNSLADEMVKSQIENRGINDPNVLSAMREIPRHVFLSSVTDYRAYGDYPLSIGFEQTISQPYMVAYMTEVLELSRKDRVLEIGTGSGYQTAVLAQIADTVFTVEKVAALSVRAEKILKELGYTNISFKVGNGVFGWKEHAPYSRIIVTAASRYIPRSLKEQLCDNGILVIPVGDFRSYQILTVMRKVGKHFEEKKTIGCRFVPLVE
ncbi:MAG: protein-L-isoaspartate(D-aspartate) O-methyltransferase [Spirochaetales bacterium]|nr:protein-L-isoaspartate(D-aspartate) O-methyltransferase [Spirochaetales bacterium]